MATAKKADKAAESAAPKAGKKTAATEAVPAVEVKPVPAKLAASSKVTTTVSKNAADPAKPAKAAKAEKAAESTTGPGGLIVASKDFDLKFLLSQQESLLEERARLTGQTLRLEKEANALIEDAEMGDVQFDEEGGEGDTMVVERERDLALSAQNRQTVAEIDAALERMAEGTYGYSVQSGQLIPKERLKFLPWASLRVDEKVGGLGRR